MDDSNAAFLRHRNGETRFCYGVHRGAHQRDIEFYVARESRAEVGVFGQNFRFAGHEQNIVKGKTLFDNFVC